MSLLFLCQEKAGLRSMPHIREKSELDWPKRERSKSDDFSSPTSECSIYMKIPQTGNMGKCLLRNLELSSWKTWEFCFHEMLGTQQDRNMVT